MSKNCNPFLKQFKDCQHYAGANQNPPTTKEKGRKAEYRIRNPERKYTVKLLVDDCLIKGDENNKCDFLYLNCDDEIAYLIELKGGDLSHAITQIERTINLLNSFLHDFKMVARIVLTKSYHTRVTNQKKEKLIIALKGRQQNQGVSVAELLKISTLRLEESI